MIKFKRRNFLLALATSGSGVLLSLLEKKGFAGIFDSFFSSDASEDVKSLKTTLQAGSPVYLGRGSGIFSDGKLRSAHGLKKLFEGGIQRVTGKNTAVEAWKTLFSESDRVGIKINALAGKMLSPKPELVDLVIRGLLSAGVKAGNILLWDKSDTDLQRAGFKISNDKNDVQCHGTIGFYEEEPVILDSVGSCFSRILTSWSTAQINVCILKDHDLAGISGSLKNWFGAIHNPNKYHADNCSPYIADLNTFAPIRKKERLIICDALQPQYHGGPAFKPEWCWEMNSLLVSTDPVALDMISWKIIDDKRKEKGLPSLAEQGRKPVWIELAEKRGIGKADVSLLKEFSA